MRLKNKLWRTVTAFKDERYRFAVSIVCTPSTPFDTVKKTVTLINLHTFSSVRIKGSIVYRGGVSSIQDTIEPALSH